MRFLLGSLRVARAMSKKESDASPSMMPFVSSVVASQKRRTGIIIAIVGMPGSGKSTLADHIAMRRNFRKVYFGGIVLAKVAEAGLPATRASEKLMCDKLRKEFGMAAVAILAAQEIDEHVACGKNIVIDGLYSSKEWSFLRSRYSERIVLVACHVDNGPRLTRLSQRMTRPLSKSAAIERDLYELRELDKAGPIVLADFHLTNNGSVGALCSAADALVKRLFRGRMRP